MKKFFKQTGVLLLTLIFFTSCGEDSATNVATDKVSDVKLSNAEPTVLNSFINFNSSSTYKQDFNPTTGIDYTTPTGDLMIRIPANAVYKDGGGNVPSDLKIVVREYFNLGDMVLGSVQTVSNKKMLVTGGNFYWEIQDNNGNSNYKVTSNVEAAMRVKTNLPQEYFYQMNYYTGQEVKQDNVTTVNWNQGKAETWMNNQNEVETEEPMFFIYGLQVGWANCDYLYEFLNGKEATQFKVKLKAKESYKITGTRVFLVSKTFPSVVNITTQKDNYYETYKKTIPMDLDAILIAVGENKDGKVFMAQKNIKVKGDDVFEMEFEPTTKTEIENKFKNKSYFD